jgi:hypothetical protein
MRTIIDRLKLVTPNLSVKLEYLSPYTSMLETIEGVYENGQIQIWVKIYIIQMTR